MRARSDLGCDFIKMQLHGLAVAGRQHRPPADSGTDCRTAGRSMHFGGSTSSHDRTSLARSSMWPRMAYKCCCAYASSGYRAWLTSRSGPQPVRAHFDQRATGSPQTTSQCYPEAQRRKARTKSSFQPIFEKSLDAVHVRTMLAAIGMTG
jgi:hypothetical protein